MKYEDFEKFVREKCMYETIYDDSDGRQILIIKMLDAYGMVNKAQREWVGLMDEERYLCDSREFEDDRKKYAEAIEAKLKEKNSTSEKNIQTSDAPSLWRKRQKNG
jgi:hypothetical protein